VILRFTFYVLRHGAPDGSKLLRKMDFFDFTFYVLRHGAGQPEGEKIENMNGRLVCTVVCTTATPATVLTNVVVQSTVLVVLEYDGLCNCTTHLY
jgi:hypothetical protein